MKTQIGARIDSLRHKRNVSVAELAETLHITERNVYRLFKKDDIWLSQLVVLNKKLDYDFFEFYKPAISEPSEQRQPLEKLKELKKTKIDEKALEVNFAVQYPPEMSDKLGQFIMHVHVLADEMGFNLV